ncbi:ABC transporter substrate-binding protein [Marinimicrococcus flavescens]|uniref:ABC transporter substrate-binding protein n=1 Tax=Marinimicrococcus flavescens TaxID=3031815 RepID=A0AAP3XS56_9PROT|nr:ABC transporter substrate-binding protein [Marinimicrococcus flavescens]
MRRAALTSVLALAFGAAAPAAAEPTLVLSAYGISQDAFKKILYEPFEAQCGCELVVEIGNSAERLAKLEARKDNPNVDVVVFADFNALEAARKDLIQPLDPSKLSNLDKLYDVARDPVGDNMAVGYTLYSTSIVYRTDKITDMGSWKDLWRPELENRVAFPNITTTQGPLALYMAERAWTEGQPSQGLETAIAKVAEIKDDVVTFYERSSQIVQLFQQEEIWAAPMGRFAWGNIMKLQMPLGWLLPAEGQTGGLNVASIVKGTEQADLAHQLIDMWLSTEVQTALAEALVDSPVNREVELSGSVAQLMTFGPEQVESLRLVPPEQLLENREAWLETWNAKVAQ